MQVPLLSPVENKDKITSVHRHWPTSAPVATPHAVSYLCCVNWFTGRALQTLVVDDLTLHWFQTDGHEACFGFVLQVTLLLLEEGRPLPTEQSEEVPAPVQACLLLVRRGADLCKGKANIVPCLLCTALKCIESVLAQKAKYHLNGQVAVALLSCPAGVLKLMYARFCT